MSNGVWERRWHPLRNEWVTITSHRNQRPWSSADVEHSSKADSPDYDPGCYLCPGNSRVSGANNGDYTGLFVFDNDHPSFSENAPSDLSEAHGIYQNAPATGTTKVMCYSPKHNLSLAELSVSDTEAVLNEWADQSEALLQRSDISQVLVFENKGEVIGVSNPHPHCQIYAASFEFKNLELERLCQQNYFKEHNAHLFEEIIRSEQLAESRIVHENDQAIGFLPYFSRFPYESYVCPKNRYAWLHLMPETERAELADCLNQMLVRYDNLWQTTFPYMLVLHQAPAEIADNFHFHIQIHPLMRQPKLQKFLAGVESGGGHFLNDVDPDQAAQQLRAVPGVHYLTN